MKRRIGRRRFLALGAAFAAARGTAFAQTTGKVHRIGVLGVTSPKVHGRFVDAFREALTERGYVEGKDLTIEYRWAEGSYGRLPELAAELIRLPVDLILTHGTPGGRAAKAATTTIPIVIAITGDAVTTELVEEAFPAIKRVAVLMNGANPGNTLTFEAMARMARSLGLDVSQVLAQSPSEVDAAFAQIARSRPEAVSIYEDPL